MACRAPRIGVGVGVGMLLLAAGCIDYVDLTRPQQREPAQVFVALSNDEAPIAGGPAVRERVHFAAAIFAGSDEQGRRAPLSDTLWLAGTPLGPHAIAADGTRQYRREWSRGSPGEVTVVLPRIARIAAEPPPLVWRPIRKLDGDSLDHVRGADLVLRLADLPDATGPRHWSLHLGGPSGSLSLHGQTTTPASFTVPAGLLAGLVASGDDRLSAAFSLSQTGRFAAAAGDLYVDWQFTGTLRWVIRVRDPAGD